MNTFKNHHDVNFLFYDYETFGLNAALDKPAQFACIRTDFNLNIIDNPKCFYCFPPNDYLPDPNSVLITGITPQYTIKNGINEFQFSKRIYNILSVKNTCIIGYNNIRFDDEFTRNIFYRNFFDSYDWSWKNNNSRWDLLDVVRACYILRPNGIIWPKNILGFPIFKLKHLTIANNIIHNKVHDAISDVYATINLAKLIQTKQPKLFYFLFQNRLKNNIRKNINLLYHIPLIYISGIFGNLRNNMTCILPIFWNIKNTNMLIFFDLYMDINLLVLFLKKNLYHNNFTFKQLFLLGINFLYINQCPILIPFNLLNIKQLNKIKVNLHNYLIKINIFHKNILLFKKLDIFFKNYIYKNVIENVDLKIYSSFFNQQDKKIMKIINKLSSHELKNIKFIFSDFRLNEMFFRYRARNFPESLNSIEKKKWIVYRNKIFNKNFLENYIFNLNILIKKNIQDFKKVHLLKDLLNYVNDYFINQ